MRSGGQMPFDTAIQTMTVSNTRASTVASAAPEMPIAGKKPTPKISRAFSPMFSTTASDPMSELSLALSQTFIMPKYSCVKPVSR